MKIRNSIVFVVRVLALALTASQSLAQSIYEPYTFTTFAGGDSFGSVDGAGSAAQFRGPSSVAVDSTGNVYVTDSDNSTIRKVTPAGVVTTLAGLAGSFGSVDGAEDVARFGRRYCPDCRILGPSQGGVSSKRFCRAQAP
jgi:hypothetical protein